MLKFVAFIHKRRAAELGLNIDAINTPYDVWDRAGLGEAYLTKFNRFTGEVIPPDDERFRNLERDPNYVKKILTSGN